MTKSFRSFGSGALLALAGGVIVAGCATQLPQAPAGIEQKIETASSRSDHEDVALQYERQAIVDAAAAKRHKGYAATYRRNTAPRSSAQAHETLARHCDRLSQTYEQAAEENIALAKLHWQLAAEAK
ncbi:hypothetical protein [Piscinibacter koreensis]|uniref:Lipoprotein n=1 Tax=Piscinibacter koreensis TaxID=2742824 RepID=A0A7Y6TYQ9_9BURK|nr:hypothetical protein [Schlegelella koreensis]NUZ08508.1 hypothetical protein [Schlegelella koreensis]